MTFFGSAKYSDTVERTPNALAKLERLRKTFAHEEADRVPISDFFWGSFTKRWREELGLADDAVLANGLAVVGGEHDQRVGIEPQLADAVEQQVAACSRGDALRQARRRIRLSQVVQLPLGLGVSGPERNAPGGPLQRAARQ